MIPSCNEAGVLGVICGVVGTLQANEAIKWILEIGQPLKGRVVRFDALDLEFQEIRIAKDPHCAICGPHAQTKTIKSIENLCEKETVMQDDVSVEWVNELMKQGSDFQFIDVRNADEYAICHIKGTKLLPMSELPSRLNEIAKDKLTVLHCHHGGRSRRAVEFLKTQGYSQVKNLAGGIDRWAQAIDPSVPRY
jgi:adenylyltransferase/sulfurtransferase